MTIRPQALKIHCPVCGWETVVQPRSDALLDGHDTFRECPRCGNTDLQTQVLSSTEAALAKLGKGVESLFSGKDRP